MKNAAKNRKAAIHIPKAEVSYSQGTVLASTPQHIQEPNAIPVHICIFFFLLSRNRYSILTMQTK